MPFYLAKGLEFDVVFVPEVVSVYVRPMVPLQVSLLPERLTL